MLIDRYFGFLSCFPIVKLLAFQCWSRAVTKSFGTRASVTVRKQRLIYIREHWICIYRAQLERCRSLIAEKTRRRTARPCLCGRRAWGQRVGNARAARHTLVYGPPTGLPFCSLCVRLFFYLPLLARFSSSPSRPRRSLHGWPGRGRNCGRWLGLPALLAARLPGSSALRDDAGTFVLRADCSPFSLRYSTREWAGLIR